MNWLWTHFSPHASAFNSMAPSPATSPSHSPSSSHSPPPFPSSSPVLFSFLLLLVVAISNTNNFFAYHAPGAVAEAMQREYHLSTSQFGLLFTLYSLPNIVLVFLGGLAIDRYGPAYTSLVFNVLMLLGTVIIALAPPSSPLPYFIAGRLLLGFGESLCAAIATMLGTWYKGRALTFSVGFNQAFVQLAGSAAAFYLLPLLGSAQAAMWVTAGVCAISFAANVLYVVLDTACARYRPDYVDVAQTEDEQEERQEEILIGSSDSSGLLNSASSPFPQYQSNGDDRWKLQGAPHNVEDEDEVVHMHAASPSASSSISASLSSLSPLYWLVVLMILLLSPILYTFTAYGPLEFQAKYGLSAAEAGRSTSVLYATIVLSPVAGYAIDTFGYRTLIQFLAAGFIPLWFALLTFTQCSPLLGMTLLGLTFAVTEANGYAMIAEVVQQEQLGVAYGITGCAVSLALLLEPASVGIVKETTGEFLISNVIFIALGAAGWAVSGWILFYDLRHGKVMSGKKIRLGEVVAVLDAVDSEEEDEVEAVLSRGVVVASEGLGNTSAMRRTSNGHHNIGYDDL